VDIAGESETERGTLGADYYAGNSTGGEGDSDLNSVKFRTYSTKLLLTAIIVEVTMNCRTIDLNRASERRFLRLRGWGMNEIY